MPLQDALYIFVRCSLAHEGGVSDNIGFVEGNGISFEILEDRVILGGGIMRGLLVVSQYAPENMTEFPEVARMPLDVVGWVLFDVRRDAHAEYLAIRQSRLAELERNKGENARRLSPN